MSGQQSPKEAHALSHQQPPLPEPPHAPLQVWLALAPQRLPPPPPPQTLAKSAQQSPQVSHSLSHWQLAEASYCPHLPTQELPDWPPPQTVA
jgi:hypothetical protein